MTDKISRIQNKNKVFNIKKQRQNLINVTLYVGALLLLSDSAFAAWSEPKLDEGIKAAFKPIVKAIMDYSTAIIAVSAISGMIVGQQQGADLKTKGQYAAVGAGISTMVVWGLGKIAGFEALVA